MLIFENRYDFVASFGCGTIVFPEARAVGS